jgi:hypothetical protein
MALSHRFWKILAVVVLVAAVVLTVGLAGSTHGGSAGKPERTSQTG